MDPVNPRKKFKTRMSTIMIVVPNEVQHDEISHHIFDLLLGVDIRISYSWHELANEAADIFQDVVVFFPTSKLTAGNIRRQMTEIHLACPEATVILVTKTDMSKFKDPIHDDESILTEATVESLAAAINDTFAARAAKQSAAV